MMALMARTGTAGTPDRDLWRYTSCSASRSRSLRYPENPQDMLRIGRLSLRHRCYALCLRKRALLLTFRASIKML